MQHKGDSECRLGRRDDRRALRLREAAVPELHGQLHADDSPSRRRPTSFLRNVARTRAWRRRSASASTRSSSASSPAPTRHIGAAGAVREDQFHRPRRRRRAARQRRCRPAGRHRAQSRRSGGAVGGGELARRAVRRHAPPRGLRHQRAAHDRALLRRLATIPTTSVPSAAFVERGYADGVPMGGDLPPRRQPTDGADLRGVGAARSRRRRSHRAAAARADRQGLARGRPAARARLRRRRRRRPTARRVDLATCMPRAAASTSSATSGAIPSSTPRSAPSTTPASLQNPTCRWSTYALQRRRRRLPRCRDACRTASRRAATRAIRPPFRSAPGHRRSGTCRRRARERTACIAGAAAECALMRRAAHAVRRCSALAAVRASAGIGVAGHCAPAPTRQPRDSGETARRRRRSFRPPWRAGSIATIRSCKRALIRNMRFLNREPTSGAASLYARRCGSACRTAIWSCAAV